MNICGCLVHIAEERLETARDAITSKPGVEIHAESDDSRFVIVVEDTGEQLASETIMGLHQIPGVISLTLTYHHFEDFEPSNPGRFRPTIRNKKGQCHDHF